MFHPYYIRFWSVLHVISSSYAMNKKIPFTSIIRSSCVTNIKSVFIPYTIFLWIQYQLPVNSPRLFGRTSIILSSLCGLCLFLSRITSSWLHPFCDFSIDYQATHLSASHRSFSAVCADFSQFQLTTSVIFFRSYNMCCASSYSPEQCIKNDSKICRSPRLFGLSSIILSNVWTYPYLKLIFWLKPTTCAAVIWF